MTLRQARKILELHVRSAYIWDRDRKPTRQRLQRAYRRASGTTWLASYVNRQLRQIPGATLADGRLYVVPRR